MPVTLYWIVVCEPPNLSHVLVLLRFPSLSRIISLFSLAGSLVRRAYLSLACSLIRSFYLICSVPLMLATFESQLKVNKPSFDNGWKFYVIYLKIKHNSPIFGGVSLFIYDFDTSLAYNSYKKIKISKWVTQFNAFRHCLWLKLNKTP